MKPKPFIQTLSSSPLFISLFKTKPPKPYFSSQRKEAMLMSCSRLFSISNPQSPLHPPLSVLESPKTSSFSPKPSNFSSIRRSITIERIPINPIFSSSQTSPSATLQPIEELPPKLQEIVKLFQAVEEPKAKYEQLLFYGRKLKPLDDQYKTSENKVQGCVSQVWVRAFLDQDKNVIFEADSDSVLTKGLAALLVQGLSGRPVEEIVTVSPDFAVLLGLQQSLTPSRNNGFLNMLKMMQRKALQLFVEAEKVGDSNKGFSEIRDEDAISGLERRGEDGDAENVVSSEEGAVNVESGSSNSGVLGARGMRIKEKLLSELKPVELEVEDVSHQHAGHAGVRGSDGETHFNLRVVSEQFEGKSLVKRHRLIYGLLQDELQSGLHALSIEAKTPSEINSSS